MISDIISSGERSVLDDDTFLSQKKTLKDLFVVYDMPAWNLILKTSAVVRTAPTHHFIETSIEIREMLDKDELTTIKTLNQMFAIILQFEI